MKNIKKILIFLVMFICSCSKFDSAPQPTVDAGIKKANTVSPRASYSTGVPFRGINVAGAEYGDDWDGWTGQSYFTWRSSTALTGEMKYFGGKGMNVFRLPISWERLQHTLNGPFDPTYQTNMINYITQATAAGWTVVLDLHNYNRYAAGASTGSYTIYKMGDGSLTPDHLVDVWKKLAALFANNNNVIFNLMNEPHDFPMTSTAWFAGVQKVVNGIRSVGAGQTILIPNSRGSDVSHWSSYAPNGGPVDAVAALSITDSANNIAYDMHAYNDNPKNAMDYVSTITEVTNWATLNNKRLFLSELGAVQGTALGKEAMGNLLAYMNAHNNVWMGWTTWNLPPYNVTPTDQYTTDGSSMAWYAPYLTPNMISVPAPTPTPTTPTPTPTPIPVVDAGPPVPVDAGPPVIAFYARVGVYSVGSNWSCASVYVKNTTQAPKDWSVMYVNMRDAKLRDIWDVSSKEPYGSVGSVKLRALTYKTIPPKTELKVGGFCMDILPGQKAPTASGIQ
jgi:endoglucanase